jgi:hypothetical protein
VNYDGTPDHEDTFIDLDGFATRPRDVDYLFRTPDGNTTVRLVNGNEWYVKLPYDTVRAHINGHRPPADAGQVERLLGEQAELLEWIQERLQIIETDLDEGVPEEDVPDLRGRYAAYDSVRRLLVAATGSGEKE